MMHPEVPVYSPPIRGDVFGRGGTTEGSIESVLAQREVLMHAGTHSLRLLDATKPHTTGEHVVGWVANGADLSAAWDESAWDGLAADTVFLERLESMVEGVITKAPHTRAYMAIGYVPRGQTNHDHMYNRGVQSLPRAHIHLTEGLGETESHVRTLRPDSDHDREMYGIFGNFAGQLSVEAFGNAVACIGEEIRITQRVGVREENVHPLDRSVFAAQSLAHALQYGLEAMRYARPVWEKHAKYVSEHCVPFGDYAVPLKQAAIPCMTVIFPSQTDRGVFGITGHIRVLVMPYAVCGPHQALHRRGAHFEYPRPTNVSTPDTMVK